MALHKHGNGAGLSQDAKDVLLNYFTAPGHYIMYVGRDVSSVKERANYVELPASVLEDEKEFRCDFLYRIRRLIGSPLDN